MMRVLTQMSSVLRSVALKLIRSGAVGAMIAVSFLIATPALAVTYTDNGNGTVTDPGTGLTWMRCSMGQTWTGSTCNGTASTYTWDQANALTGTTSFASQSDWRLPNIRELQSIVDRSRFGPAIDSGAFPNTKVASFWSASAYASPNAYDSNYAWYVYFYAGDLGYSGYYKAEALQVRLVRGGQSSGSLLNPARPTADYVDHGDGTVTHTPTGLMWQRCVKGLTWSGGTCSGNGTIHTWDEAVAMTDSLAGYSDWRLPNAEELLSLEDYTIYRPVFNTAIFGLTVTDFWSASVLASERDYQNSGYAWYVSVWWGQTEYELMTKKLYVRLVRAGGSSGGTTSTASTTTTTSPTSTTTTVGSTTTTTQISGPQSSLNDTGLQAFGNASSNALTTEPVIYPGQDARYGRDAAAMAGQLTKVGAGTKGFDFTKIANNGTALPATAALGTGSTDWGCTRDNVTGLIWQANPYATTMTWDQASQYPGQLNAPQLCGYYDWRLPTVTELTSIVDFGQTVAVSVDTNYLPSPTGTVATAFWTAVPYPGNAGNSWSVVVGYGGYDTVFGNATTLAVRLVRGGPAYTAAAETTPTADFVDNSNGTVTHQKTGLTWMRCALGQTWSGSTCTGTAGGYDWQQALSAQFTFTASGNYGGRTGWRLPNIKELQSLYEFARTNPTVVPAINTTVFPNMPAYVQGSSASHFWSASANAKVANDAWTIGFDNGDIQTVAKANLASVRLVNGGYAFDAAATGSSSSTSTTTSTSSTAATTTTTAVSSTTTTVAGTTTTTLSFAIVPGNLTVGRVWHTATVLNDGKVLLTGGYGLSSAEIYDPAAKTFSATGSMSVTRYSHAAAPLPNGKVLVTGGTDASTGQILSSGEVYDPAGGAFAAAGSMASPRVGHSTTLLPNGKVLIAGGTASASGGAFYPTNSAEIYDPATGTFISTGSMGSNRTSHVAVLLTDGRVLMAGGSNYYNYLSSAEIYDPASGTFSAAGTMTASRAFGVGAVLLSSGQVLITGGGNSAYLGSAEIYDPSTKQFSATGAMHDVRRDHTSTLLPSGKVLVAGGQNTNTTRIAAAEIFDPATGAFTRIADMSVARGGHTATLLQSGDVLLAAGANSITHNNTAELYGAGTTSAFHDNFDMLNTANWWLARGSNNDLFGEGKAFDASGVTFANGYASLNADVTDQVGVMYSRPLPVTKGDIVTIKRKVFVHAANRYYGGAFNVYEVADSALSAAKPNTFAPLFGLMYYNFTYQTDLNLFSLVAKGRVPYGPGDYSGGTAPQTAPLWDQWFDEEYIYDSGSGETVYKINGVEKMRTQANPLSQPYIKIMMHSYGWNTGHYMMVDSLSVGTRAAGSAAGSMNLVSGWNLVGNSASGVLDVAATFGDSSKVTTVWKWLAAKANWAFYTPTLTDGGAAYAATKGYDFMTAVAGGEGFWVNAKAAFTASLPSGTAITSTSFQGMGSGWNLIAIGDNKTPSAFNIALSLMQPSAGEIPLNVTTLWAWDAGLANWYFYAPSLDKSGGLASYITSKNYLDFGTKVLDPTTGFWVNKP